MGRLTEAVYMVNCTPNEWSKYAVVINEKTPYITRLEREELKRLRKLYRNKK